MSFLPAALRHRLAPAALLAAGVGLLALVAVVRPPAAHAAATPVAEVVRSAGSSRQATAVEVSRHAYPNGSRTVLLARQDHYADALAGGPLAAALEAPILLAPTDALSPAVLEELVRLAPDEVLLLGGEQALWPQLAAEVRSLGIRVERLAGDDRFRTAVAIGDRLLTEVPPAPGRATAIIVEGANLDPNRGWPDAVAASALAAVLRAPVLLATTGELPDQSAAALDAWDVDHTILVGGETALSPVVAETARRHTNTVERIAGQDRYETSALAADRAVDAGASRTAVWVASGRNWPDALVAGPAAAAEGGVLLLSPPSPTAGATSDWLTSHAAELRTVRLVGGTMTLADDHVEAVSRLLPDAGDFQPWSDPATWGGRVPTAGQDVTIAVGQRVLLDVRPPALDTLTIDGELEFARLPGLGLRADVVRVTGRLGIGDPGRPFPHDVLVELDADLDGPHAGEATGTGALTAFGGTLDLFGRRDARPWTLLARSAAAGDTVLELQETTGWAPGDRLAIAPSGLDPDEAEEAVVASVDGNRVTLASPLVHPHHAAADSIPGEARSVEQFTEIALLDRSIRILGVDEDGGHVMATPLAGRPPRVHVSGVEFDQLGQAGVSGRYPLHFHLSDSVTGSFVREASVHHSQSRCVTIHGSSDIRVTSLVAYGTAGHCVFFEDGAETGNVVHDSLVFGLRPPSDADRLLDTDRTPAAYWIQHPRNVVRFSNAAGGEGFGFWCDLPEHPTGPSATDDVDNRTATYGMLRDLTAHSFRAPKGSDDHRTGTGLMIEDYRPTEPVTIRRVNAWKNDRFGVWQEDGDLTLTESVLTGNGTGFLGNGTSLEDSLVVGTSTNDRQRPYYLHGLGLYTNGATVRGVTFANFQHEDRGRDYAIGANTEHMRTFQQLSDLRFVDSNLLRLQPVWSKALEVSSGVIDLDGSLGRGGPRTIVADNSPLLWRNDCAFDTELDGRVCDGVARTSKLSFADQGARTADFTGGTLRSDDGHVGALEMPSHAQYDGPRAQVTVVQDQHYAVAWPLPTPAVLELVNSSNRVGGVVVTIPWPYGELFAYEGWGDWATGLATAPSASAVGPSTPINLDATADRLTVWIDGADTDGEDVRRRYRLCAAANCDDGTGSERD